MEPLRQRAAAELMLGHDNDGKKFALALLAATPEGQLATRAKRRKAAEMGTITRQQMTPGA